MIFNVAHRMKHQRPKVQKTRHCIQIKYIITCNSVSRGMLIWRLVGLHCVRNMILGIYLPWYSLWNIISETSLRTMHFYINLLLELYDVRQLIVFYSYSFKLNVGCIGNLLVWKLFCFYYVVIYITLIAYCYLNVNYFLYEANIYINVM